MGNSSLSNVPTSLTVECISVLLGHKHPDTTSPPPTILRNPAKFLRTRSSGEKPNLTIGEAHKLSFLLGQPEL